MTGINPSNQNFDVVFSWLKMTLSKRGEVRRHAWRVTRKSEPSKRYTGRLAALALIFALGLDASLLNTCVAKDEAQRQKIGPLMENDGYVNGLLLDAWNSLRRNDFHRALYKSDMALVKVPKSGQALLFKGYCLYKLDQPAEAVNYIRRGINVTSSAGKVVVMAPDGGLSYSWYVLAAALAETNRPQEALEVLDTAISKYSDVPALYGERGNLYNMMNQPEKALTAYSDEIAANPKLSMGYENRGNLLLKMKKPDLAIKDFTRAISLEPSNSILYASRAKAYKLMNKLELAEQDNAKANGLGSAFMLGDD